MILAMNRFSTIALIPLFLLCALAGAAQEPEWVNYVDPAGPPSPAGLIVINPWEA